MPNVIKWVSILQPRGEFKIYPDENGKIRWKIVSVNSTIIGASSQWFSSESYCEENAKLVMQGIAEFLKNSKSPLKPIILPSKKIVNPLGGLLSKGIPNKTISKPALIPLFSKLTKNG